MPTWGKKKKDVEDDFDLQNIRANANRSYQPRCIQRFTAQLQQTDD